MDEFNPESFCEICGDEGGASSMVVCENQHLGCLGGVHLYCMLPLRTELPSEEWFCTFCAEAAKAAAHAQQEVENAAMVSGPVVEPASQRRKMVANPPPPKAPIAPAPAPARDVFSAALDAVTDDEAERRRVEAHERSQRRRYQAAQAQLHREQRQDYQLARCRAGGVLWKGRLHVMLQGAAMTLPCLGFPAPADNALSAEAAGILPEDLRGGELIPLAELQVTEMQLCKESCLALASADGSGAGAANWRLLKQWLEGEKAALKVELCRPDGLLALLVPNSSDPEAALSCVMAEPLSVAQPRPAVPARGVLRKPSAARPGQPLKLTWGDGYISTETNAQSRAGEEWAPSPATQELAAGERPLEGLRISALAMKLPPNMPEVTQLRNMGVSFIWKSGAYPGCQDIIVVHSKAVLHGLERVTDCNIAACLAAPTPPGATPLCVFEGTAILDELRTKRRLLTSEELRADHLKMLFPSGFLLLTDVPTLQSMDPGMLNKLLERLNAGLQAEPSGVWRMALHPDDLRAWEQAVEQRSGADGHAEMPGAANLRTWKASKVTGGLQTGEISNTASELPSLMRHAIKAAHNLRHRCRTVFLMTTDEALLRKPPPETVLVDTPELALETLQHFAGLVDEA